MATIQQMKSRMLQGHRLALEAIRDGRDVVRTGAYPSEIRGMRKCVSTLIRWGAVSDGKLTDIGRQLLS